MNKKYLAVGLILLVVGLVVFFYFPEYTLIPLWNTGSEWAGVSWVLIPIALGAILTGIGIFKKK